MRDPPKPRYRALTSVTDYSVSQKIRTALVEDGHTDLAIELITVPVRTLEEQLGGALKRIQMLEDANRERLTESAVLRLIEAKNNAIAVDWAKWGFRAATLLAAGAAGRGLSKWLK